LKRDNAIVAFIRQVHPCFPGPNPQVFLCELLFVLCDLCDEIDLRGLIGTGQKRYSAPPKELTLFLGLSGLTGEKNLKKLIGVLGAGTISIVQGCEGAQL